MNSNPVSRNSGLAAIALAVFLIGALPACGGKGEEAKDKKPMGTLITVAKAESVLLPVTQESVGWLESRIAPYVSAEVGGRVTKVHVDAGAMVKAGQLLAEMDADDLALAQKAAAATYENQKRLVERYRQLVEEEFISKVTLEGAESQLTALESQLALADNRLAKARIKAPVGGQIEQRLVSVGSYLDPGKPAFMISTGGGLRAFLPFPETVSNKIMPGLAVELSTPTAPGAVVDGVIVEIRPSVGMGNRALMAIVDVKNPGGWKPGASVTGIVTLEKIPDAVVVPEECVVRRPAGDVVYVISNGTAVQRVVATGQRNGGKLQITSGLAAGETVAQDGAGYLSDKAPVNPQGAKNAAPSAAAPALQGPETGKEKAK
ncbi:MAG: efflux RND transporter periplasmic adaptor subunit [Nitrospinae bacterium]|nr:efflux RND transporter periplasmic adaptor subunit [Nitrospinota bacterium]